MHISRICTAITTSLSLPQRQVSSLYAIHAGHHSSDKEFRYLSTLRVRAVVKAPFHQERELPTLLGMPTGQASTHVHVG